MCTEVKQRELEAVEPFSFTAEFKILSGAHLNLCEVGESSVSPNRERKLN
jgi:hypothetical protein